MARERGAHMANRLTLRERDAIRREIQKRVEQHLPEDEHDYTSPWVYDLAIAVTANHLGVAVGRRNRAERAQ